MNPHFTITNTMTNGLAQIERARGFLEAAHLSEAWIRRMRERALLLNAHPMTPTEGTRITSHAGCRAITIVAKMWYNLAQVVV